MGGRSGRSLYEELFQISKILPAEEKDERTPEVRTEGLDFANPRHLALASP